MRKKTAGVTMLEIAMAITCMIIVLFAFQHLSRLWMQWAVKGWAGVRANMSAQTMANHIVRDFYAANEIVQLSSTSITFITDISRRPDYRPTAVNTDGIENQKNPDYDNDASSIPAPGQSWRVGFNLKDDDEDNDSKIDYRIRYTLVGRKLYRDVSTNESPWGTNLKMVADNVKFLKFEYFGSKGLPLGEKIDTGNDGLLGTTDAGENDGVITATEIDMTHPSNGGGGNRNGLLDTKSEFIFITSVRIQIELDVDNNGTTDYLYKTELSPPLLPVKALQI